MTKPVGIFLLIFSGLANAAVIDFEDLGVASGSRYDPPDDAVITSGGYTFVNGPNEACCSDLHFANNNGQDVAGTTELISHGDVIAMNAGSDSFSLLSFDFGSSFGESFTSLIVVGQYSGGGSVTQNFSIDGDLTTLETILLSGAFNNLTSVNWLATGGQQIFSLDNISVVAVPIPAAAWLFGSALAGLGWLRRKHFVPDITL
jgi:hypothetical protein